jgi:hypothetical protein
METIFLNCASHSADYFKPDEADYLTCGQNRFICDPDATCTFQPNIQDYFCICNPGLVGDGFTCLVDPYEDNNELITGNVHCLNDMLILYFVSNFLLTISRTRL